MESHPTGSEQISGREGGREDKDGPSPFREPSKSAEALERERESLRGQTDCEKGKRSGCASGKKKKKLSRRKGSTKTTRTTRTTGTKPAREGRRKNKSIHALQKGKTNRDNAC